MYTEVMQELAAQIGSALGVSVVKGYPAWGRPNMSPPVVALLADRIDLSDVGRIGVRPMAATWRAIVFGRHEQEMLALAEALIRWAYETRAVVVDGSEIPVQFLGGSRFMGATGAQQEDYGFELAIQTMIQEV
ncbi:MAG: hypothetical protein Kow0047_15870 [Anaerolineae bacterium]